MEFLAYREENEIVFLSIYNNLHSHQQHIEIPIDLPDDTWPCETQKPLGVIWQHKRVREFDMRFLY